MNSQVYSNMDSVRNYNIFARNSSNASKAMTRATTSLRIASVKDAPAQWAISEKMRERINSLSQASKNIQNDTNMMKTAEDGINNTVSNLNTIRARVLHAASDDATTEDRLAISKEIHSLFEQIEYNATNTRYNGKLLLATAKKGQGDTGAADTSATTQISFRFQIGDDENAYVNFNLQNMTLKGLGLSSATQSIDTLRKMDAVGITANSKNAAFLTPGSNSEFLTALDTAIDKALGAATDIGSYEQRLGYVEDSVATQIENLEASDSTIRNSDMAKEITEYMKWSVLAQASQYMLAQSNQNAFSALNLLQ